MNKDANSLVFHGKCYSPHTIVNVINLGGLIDTDSDITQAEYIKTNYDVRRGQLYYFKIIDNNSYPKMIAIAEDELGDYITVFDENFVSPEPLVLNEQDNLNESDTSDEAKKSSVWTMGKSILVIITILAIIVGVLVILVSVPGLIQVIGCLILLALAGVFLLGTEVVGAAITFLIAFGIVLFLFSDAGRPVLILIGVGMLALFIRAIVKAWKDD